MWELVKAGGWLMTPIVVCSILALVIIIERSHTLQFNKVAPSRLREQLITRLRENGDIGRTQLMNVKEKTPLGDILATGLLYRQYGLDSMTMHMQNRASVQVHQLEKNINMLGTIGRLRTTGVVRHGVRHYFVVFGDYRWRDARPNDACCWCVTSVDYDCCWYDRGYSSTGCLSLFSAPYYRY